MSQKTKIIILVVVVIVAAVILINPLNSKITQFKVTDNPQQTLQKDIANGKPVFLDFYSST